MDASRPVTEETAPPTAWPARALAASAGLALLAAAFAWSAPSRNGWAALALVAALILDGLGRLAERRLAARGETAAIAGMPSLVLAVGPGAAIAVAALVAWPAAFPVIASALAGLVAMGAIARLALARIVGKLDEAPDEP